MLRTRHSVLPGFTLSFALSVFFICLVILVPLSGLVLHVSDMSWDRYWSVISNPRSLASFKVTVLSAAGASLINAVVGMLLAWVLVRYRFPGRRVMDALVDLPFALPTAVAGLTLSALFAANGWLGQWFEAVGIPVAYTPLGIMIAMSFTSLPFVVRAVQPVLEDLTPDVEEAAATLGATPMASFFKVVLAQLMPALLTGTALAFTRSLGEYGAVIFIAGNMPFETEIISLLVNIRLEEYDFAAASALASVILGASLVLLFGIQVVQGRMIKRWQGG
ncbi:sulfate ABC transporter permease subunit CysT [Alcanivorax marinus]|uniref:Sulfate transport system permease protein CysT n=1 Tax=Alloalcanivorax marinus TaxID=1177169 RepID=A0A9Q3ULL6_9GAMM|nr:sulfate ABC transporter permease subunit CysT [Alloalcanivorax marinus]MCC4307273.1 sulfate ABC transporter permease subunit CysT [Alloalcanivorax marinus]MCH2558170.1 sulfate ABC transporter permease subunit CysT [Alcanivorax sp.]